MDSRGPGADAKPHRNLRVWQAAIELTDAVYAVTQTFPTTERFGLAAQMQRAAVSVPSNIAEGAARASNAEFPQFLHAARGSLAELDTQFGIAQRRGYVPASQAGRIVDLMGEVGRTLQGLIARRKRVGQASKLKPNGK